MAWVKQRLDRERKITEEIAPVWIELRKQLETAVDEFTEPSAPHRPSFSVSRRCVGPDILLITRRHRFSEDSIEASVDRKAAIVNIRFSGETDPRHLSFSLGDDGKVTLTADGKPLTPEQASQLILESFLFASPKSERSV